MEKDLTDQEVKDFLSDNFNDADLDSGIHTVAVLFAERAIPRLLAIVQSQERSFDTLKNAAIAIRDIGAESIANDLLVLKCKGDTELRELAACALSWVNRNL